ncbi:DUF4054 domain-containing protein [Pseudomonas sp. NPDC098747]|uniref:DUF4054 domain-containing protein n=1 Tax=Pseudomonas sp. NPDC098747 TaxID=3364487 RepID=UPI00383B8C1B
MDVAQFRADFPEFADTSKYPDSAINLWLNLAIKVLAPDRWCDYLDTGLGLYTAHFLTVATANKRAAAVGGAPGQAKGPLISKSVAGVSATYATSALTPKDGSAMNLTTYGIQYTELAQMVGMGGMQL